MSKHEEEKKRLIAEKSSRMTTLASIKIRQEWYATTSIT
jgi:hypothetical protein